jgi:hypothetical protein
MINHWVDMVNADVTMIMGNPAQNHPIAMKWIQKTKERGAIIFQVDPRFNRTSYIADASASDGHGLRADQEPQSKRPSVGCQVRNDLLSLETSTRLR